MLVLVLFLAQYSWGILSPQIEKESSCEKKLECFALLVGARIENQHEDGEIFQQIETTNLILKSRRNFLGLLDYVDVYDKKSLTLLSREWFGAERVTLSFGEDSQPTSKRIIKRMETNHAYYEDILIFYEKGRPTSQIVKYFNQDSKILEYSQCLSGIPPTAITARDLSRVVAGVFRSEATSPTSIRLVNSNCPESVGKDVTESMKQGMACMLDSRRAGTARSERDVGLLLSLMSNPARPFTVKCFQGGTGIPGHGHVLGAASMCNNVDPGNAPYPGINLDLDAFSKTEPARTKSVRATIYHEMLHTLGYPHGHAPDVSYWCEYCCFKEGHANLKKQACNLCRQPDNPPPSYIGDMFKYSQDASNTGMDYNEDFAYLSTEDYARNLFASSGGNKNAAAILADSLISKCPRGNPAKCDYQMAKAALVMLKAQEALANARTPGVAALTPEQLKQVTQLSSVFFGSEDVQAATLTGGIMAGYMQTGTKVGAQQFARQQMRAKCSAIPSGDKQYIAGAMPMAFSINFKIGDSADLLPFVCP